MTAKLDWKKVLRYFVKTSERANKTSSIKKINRRYAYIHPGKKVRRQARIAISIDQSGSVDDSMLALFYAELNKLSDIAEFTVIPFDDQVFEEKVYVWKKSYTSFSEYQKLTPELQGANMNFGSSIAIKDNFVVVGAPNHTHNSKEKAGSVYYYKYNDY